MMPHIGYERPEGATSQEGLTEMKFPVVLHKDADSDYGVIVPDVPGCFSAGSTVSQAFENVKEALSLHYEGLVADGEPLPQVREIDVHLDNPDYADGIWGVVDFDITPYFGKSVRFNASLPEQLLERIDQTVRRDQRYSSRSGFLAAAALRELST
ncbi:type II toxin-antitoxin system HicB family antitoxin [Pseudomonas sp. PB120]|uniref:type II toxin-antitoxin system HicB family antitoxin n=1 Tax=Pseudomonas sp. PB120 TaxID=2494700 RepID=UPI0015B56F84|nr:type II toxin-antitoxin system HicB family antitoxin [Pseudomonas sp. PB120]